MKTVSLGLGYTVRLAFAVAAVALLASSQVMATNLFWSGGGATQGGTGTWTTAASPTRFGTAAAGPYGTQWVNANVDSAEFGGTSGTVNLAGPITVNTIQTDITGFTIGNGNGVSGAANQITFSGANSGINTAHTSGATTLTAFLSGTTLTKMGPGRLSLENSANSNTAKYVLKAGALTLANSNRFGTTQPGTLVSDFVTFDGGGLGFNTTTTGITFGNNRGITITANGGFLSTSSNAVVVTLDAPIAGSAGGNLTFGGNPSAWTGSGHTAGGVWTLTNTGNTWNGGLVLNGASGTTVKIGASGVIPDTAVVTNSAAGNVFDLNGFDETIKGLSGTAGTIAVGTKTLTLADGAGAANGYSSVISASTGGKVIKNGSGVQVLSGSSTGFNGEFVMNAGTLGIGSANVFGNAANTSKVTINGGVLSNTGNGGRSIPAPIPVALSGDFGADDSLFNSATPGQILFNGPATINGGNRTITVTGTANLGFGGAIGQDAAGRGIIKQGNGILALNAVNTYTGSTQIDAGELRIDGDGTLGDGTGALILNGGKLNVSASRDVTTDPITNPINLSANSTIATTSAATTVNANFKTNSFTFTNGTTLTFKNEGADGAGDTFKPRFSGSGFDFTEKIVIDNGAVGKTELNSFNQGSTIQTFSGDISGSGSYNRNSDASNPGSGGVTILTGNNTYTGGTTVSDGTLLVNNTVGSGTGTGDVIVNTNGKLGGSGTIGGNVKSSGVLSPGNSPGALTIGGDLSLLAGSYQYQIDTTPTATADLTSVAGDLNITAAAVALDSSGSVAGTALAMGTKFTLINYGKNWNGGTFLGLANYDTSLVIGVNRFQIIYDDTSGGSNFGGGTFVNNANLNHWVTITAVPEASTFFTLGLGGIFAIAAVWMTKRMGINLKA